jgi:ferredoxin
MENSPSQPLFLSKSGKIGPYPTHKLKRVDKPTVLVTDNVQRIDARELPIIKAARGDYGPVVENNSGPNKPKCPLGESISDVLVQVGRFEGSPVAAEKAPITEDPEILSRHIKRMGYFLKADVMGICELPKYAVYSHDPAGNPLDLNYKYAIVIAMRMEYETIDAAKGSDWSGDLITFQGYQRCAVVAQDIAEYIRRLGYPASAQHAKLHPYGYQVCIPPLLLASGIGEISRAGIIVSPFLGASYKASAVLTDLPLVPDKPIDFGLQDFCHRCKLCAIECPSKSISMGDKVMYNGYETWKLDEKSCASFCSARKKGTMCVTCAKVCPWSRPNTWDHNLVRWAVQRSSLARRATIKADDIWRGHRHEHPEKKWWFDLVDRKGVLTKLKYDDDS